MAFRKQRMGRKKVCYFTKNKITYIDYKDVELLKRFVSANGKIIPRRVTGTSAKSNCSINKPWFNQGLLVKIIHQRMITLILLIFNGFSSINHYIYTYYFYLKDFLMSNLLEKKKNPWIHQGFKFQLFTNVW